MGKFISFCPSHIYGYFFPYGSFVSLKIPRIAEKRWVQKKTGVHGGIFALEMTGSGEEPSQR